MAQQYVITTVHGTFASRATWPLENSELCRFLRKELPGPVQIRPFRWSGRNGFGAREKAALGLREHLQRAIRENPDSAHFVIAHSHGGNVALLAMADANLEKRIAGIVCLSTPFLQAWPRPLGKARVVMVASGIVIILANVLYFVLRPLGWWGSPAFWSILLAAIPGVWYLNRSVQRMLDSPKWVLPEFDPKRMLIIRTAGDEASALLGAVTLFGSLTTRVWAFTAEVPRRAIAVNREAMKHPRQFSRWAKLYQLGCFTFSMVAVALCAASLLSAERLVTNTQATFALLAALAIHIPIEPRKILVGVVFLPLWWVSCVLVGPVLLLLSIVALFFGPSLAFLHLFFQVAAEPTPPGVWMTIQQDPSELPDENLGLMHSTLYNDARAHAHISYWIRKQISE